MTAAMGEASETGAEAGSEIRPDGMKYEHVHGRRNGKAREKAYADGHHRGDHEEAHRASGQQTAATDHRAQKQDRPSPAQRYRTAPEHPQ